MNKKTIWVWFILMISMGFLRAQIQGNFDLQGVYVQYTYEVRDTTASQNDQMYASYDVTVSWPSSATPMYTHVLQHFEIGDTVAVTEVPLVTPELMALAGYLLTGDPTAPGVAINVDMNDDGTFIINEGSIYPTTGDENCSTFATLPPVSENGTWAFGGDPIVNQDSLTMTWGWAITLSNIFANFSAPDLAGGDQLGVDYGPGTPMPDWGMLTANYNADFSIPLGLNIYWEAHDGVGSGLGIDDNGLLNGFVGIPVLSGDTVTVATLNAVYGLSLNVGDYPIIGGEGQDLDGDGVPDGVVEATNWGYLFDPKGPDEVPFSGDEVLQFTGYYFTYNFLAGTGLAGGVFEALAGVVGITAAATAAVDTVLETFGLVDAAGTGFDAIRAAVSAVAGDSVATWIAAGMDASDALSAGVWLVGVGGATAQTAGAWTFPDDSDHDYDATDGRLVFEVDNRCIPDNTTQRVETWWANTATINTDPEPLTPQQFAVYENYPNPFNPSTKIVFDLPDEQYTTVTVWNLVGQKIATLYSGDLQPGQHAFTFAGRDLNGNVLPSGIYFYRVDAGKYHSTKKMMLLK